MSRAILVDPYRREITEVEADSGAELTRLIGKDAAETWMVPCIIPDHIGFVDSYGLTNGRPCWYFHGMHVWGPMLILSSGGHPAQVPLERVRPLVAFRD